MPIYRKSNIPVDDVRRFLEPGPIVLVSSQHKRQRAIMTMGWHMILGFSPSLVGCFIWDQNDSHAIIRRSKQCVINLPTYDMIKTVIAIGNSHSSEADKFTRFHLTPTPAKSVDAPMIAECYANFECELIDTSLINKYSLFVFEVVKAHVAKRPKYPTTIHYRGEGVFMVSGKNVDHRKSFKPEML